MLQWITESKSGICHVKCPRCGRRGWADLEHYASAPRPCLWCDTVLVLPDEDGEVNPAINPVDFKPAELARLYFYRTIKPRLMAEEMTA